MKSASSFVAFLCLFATLTEGKSVNALSQVTCPPEREHYIPHPTNCFKYFLCVDGEPQELPCPLEWIFDYLQLRCLPIGGECQADLVTESPVNATTPENPSSASPNSTTATTPAPNTTVMTTISPNSTLDPSTTETPSPFVCPPVREKNMPHPTNCSRYFLCVDGRPYDLPCPSGWLFDSIELRCLPFGARCFNDNNSSTTLSPNSTTTMSPNSSTTLSPNSSTTLSPNSTTTLSPNSSTTTLSPNSTTTFYPNSTTTLYPNSTTPTTFSPNSTAPTTFSPNSTTPSTPSPLTTTEVPLTCPERGEAFIPHPENCSKYFLCVDGNPRVLDCPSDWIFDYIQLRCVPIDGRCVTESFY